MSWTSSVMVSAVGGRLQGHRLDADLQVVEALHLAGQPREAFVQPAALQDGWGEVDREQAGDVDGALHHLADLRRARAVAVSEVGGEELGAEADAVEHLLHVVVEDLGHAGALALLGEGERERERADLHGPVVDAFLQRLVERADGGLRRPAGAHVLEHGQRRGRRARGLWRRDRPRADDEMQPRAVRAGDLELLVGDGLPAQRAADGPPLEEHRAVVEVEDDARGEVDELARGRYKRRPGQDVVRARVGIAQRAAAGGRRRARRRRWAAGPA